MNRKQYTIAGIKKLGYTPQPGRSRKYLCFEHPLFGAKLTLLVGKAGALRKTRGELARSVSLTDSRLHAGIAYVGQHGPEGNPEACMSLLNNFVNAHASQSA